MTNCKTFVKALLGATALTALTAGSAFAGGTTAGTNVQNTFTLDYKVGSVAQPTIDTGPAGSNTPTEFTVDRLVDLTVEAKDPTVNVFAGAQDQELVFSVVNDGNSPQSYALSTFEEAPVGGGTDFDATGVTVTYYVDDGDGVFEPGAGDGAAQAYVDHTGSVPADGRIWVVLTGDIPTLGTVNDGDKDSLTLVADTLEPTALGAGAGAEVVPNGANVLTSMQNVLGDGTSGARENANEGDDSAVSTWVVATADVSATKTVQIINEDGTGCDNFATTATAGAYSVPGACVEYTITVENTGAAQAEEVVVVDILPQELTFAAAQDDNFDDTNTAKALTVPGTVAEQNCDGTAATCEVKLEFAELDGGETGTVRIRALLK